MIVAVLWVLGTLGWAGDCDGVAAQARSAVDDDAAWQAWIGCDAAAARAHAVEGLAGTPAASLAVRALQVDAPGPVTAWLDGLGTRERVAALRGLADACDTVPAVSDYLAARLGGDPETVAAQRWPVALGACRAAPVQQALRHTLADPAAPARVRLDAARAVATAGGADAVPTLAQALRTTDDATLQSGLVEALGRAAGFPAGAVDAQAAAAVGEALNDVAPDLPPAVLDEARSLLVALDQPDAADHLAAERWPDRRAGGGYRLAVAVREIPACEGRPRATLHLLTTDRTAWPDRLPPLAVAHLRDAGALTLAARCDGEERLDVRVPDVPFVDEASRDDWLDAQADAFAAEAPEGTKTRVRRSTW